MEVRDGAQGQDKNRGLSEDERRAFSQTNPSRAVPMSLETWILLLDAVLPRSWQLQLTSFTGCR